MASAWGDAWGSAWGDSWGAISSGAITPWVFTDISNAVLSATVQESNVITIAGITSAVLLSFSGHASAQWKKNGGAYIAVSTTASVSVEAGDTIQLSLSASSLYSTATSVTMAGDGVSDTFTVTTLATPDATPTAPIFTSVANAVVSTQYQQIQSVTGMTIGETLTAVGTGLELSNDGVNYFTSLVFSATTTLRISNTSSATAATANTVTGTINGVSVSFTVTTALEYYDSARHMVDSGS